MTGTILDKARVRALTIAALLAIPFTAGCPLTTEPEDDTDEDGVQGVWIVTQVDGAPLPPAGFLLEPGILVRSISLTFNKPDMGSVLAIYQIVRNGVGEPPKKVAGSFKYYDNSADEDGTVYVFAFKERAVGVVYGDDMDVDEYIAYTDRTGASVRRRVQLHLRR